MPKGMESRHYAVSGSDRVDRDNTVSTQTPNSKTEVFICFSVQFLSFGCAQK